MNLSSQVLKTLKFTFKNPLRKKTTLTSGFQFQSTNNQQRTTTMWYPSWYCTPNLLLLPPGAEKKETPKSRLFFLSNFDSFWVSIHETGIFTYIYHKSQPNVGKYTIHGMVWLSCCHGICDLWCGPNPLLCTVYIYISSHGVFLSDPSNPTTATSTTTNQPTSHPTSHPT